MPAGGVSVHDGCCALYFHTILCGYASRIAGSHFAMSRNQEFHFSTTHIGSMPHQVVASLAERLNNRLDIPAWPQLPRRSYRESMYVQYSPSLPAIREDSRRRLIYFDTTDMAAALERFYSAVLLDDLETFALRPEYSAGFFAMLDRLHETSGEWAKGQVTGPVSLGLAISDQNQCASLYDETLVDVILKNVAMNARWQIRQLKPVRSNVIIFVDEPYLSFFGSAFLGLGRAQIIPMLDEVFEAIQAEGAWAGVHCCANTDWGLLLSTKADILNLDAFGYLENLALYPVELHDYMQRGGSICWGIVPNDARVRGGDSRYIGGSPAQGHETDRSQCRSARGQDSQRRPGNAQPAGADLRPRFRPRAHCGSGSRSSCGNGQGAKSRLAVEGRGFRYLCQDLRQHLIDCPVGA